MSIQSQFDNEALRFLPKVLKKIEQASKQDAVQMRCKALQVINVGHLAISEMSEKEREKVEKELLRIFKYKGWF